MIYDVIGALVGSSMILISMLPFALVYYLFKNL
jgi:hypothetical protein